MEIIRKKEQPEEDRGGYLVRKMLSKPIKSGFSVDSIAEYLTTVPVGGKCREHYHKNSYESVLFLDSGIGIINGEKYQFEEGDNLLLEPGDRHEFIPIGQLRLFAVRIPDLPQDKITI